jgi:6-phosphofructokinase 1
VAETDRREAFLVGQEAVVQLARGQSGFMVTVERTSNQPYQVQPGLAPLADVANAEKLLPKSFIAPAGNQITQDFFDYALPLVDGPFEPLARLEAVRVPKILSQSTGDSYK